MAKPTDEDALFQQYLLSRLGLLPDELDWPSNVPDGNFKSGLISGGGGVSEGPAGAWRSRDPLTSILGKEGDVSCETGTTSLEEEQSTEATAPMVPVASIVESLLSGNLDETEGPLDPNAVRRAFNAAAYAVVRGRRRTATEKISTPAATPDAGSIAAPGAEGGGRIEGEGRYDPPLLAAAESIRRARLAALDEAASGPPVPPFKKMDNTIPWFHVPIEPRKGGRPPNATAAALGAAPSAESGRPSSVDSSAEANTSGKMEPQSAVEKAKEKGTNKRGGDGDSLGRLEPPKKKKAKVEKGDIVPSDVPSGASKKKAKKTKQSSGVSGGKDGKDGKEAGALPPSSPPPLKKRHRTPILTPSSKSSLSASKAKVGSPPGRPPHSSSMDEAGGIGVKDGPTCRAVIVAAASEAFRELDPDRATTRGGAQCGDEDGSLDAALASLSTKKKREKVDADEVASRARRLADRVRDRARGFALRADRRRQFGMDDALRRTGKPTVAGASKNGSSAATAALGVLGSVGNPFLVKPAHSLPLVAPNPFLVSPGSSDDDGACVGSVRSHEDLCQGQSWLTPLRDPEWDDACLPRLLSILGTGAGHAVLQDRRWTDRARRVASLLRGMAEAESSTPLSSGARRRLNYGPHLIITSSGEEFEKFARAFGGLGHGLDGIVQRCTRDGGPSAAAADSGGVSKLRVLPYRGSTARRRRLRRHFNSLLPSPDSHFASLGGLPDSPFHVVLTTYSALFEDYAHFCQIAFEVVVMDDGMAWLGCACTDSKGKVGQTWAGMWGRADGAPTISVAGATLSEGGSRGREDEPWDFGKDFSPSEPLTKSGSVAAGGPTSPGGDGGARGRPPASLQARHRLLLASDMHANHGGQVIKVGIMGLLSFLAPQFADAVAEDWDRCRVSACKRSMAQIRTVMARLMVVYNGDGKVRGPRDLIGLSSRALDGELPPLRACNATAHVEEDAGVDELVQCQKVHPSRRQAACWFPPGSPARDELTEVELDAVLILVKAADAAGFVCEEVVPASGGSVLGPMAYRPGTRCGRCFGSEQGLRHHIASMHAPPGTWACQSCGIDCGTNSARSNHERSCGASRKGSRVQGSLGGGALSAALDKRRGPKKKEVKNPPSTVIAQDEEKPSKRPPKALEGAVEVPGYKGVWARPDGMYVVQVDDKLYVENHPDKEGPALFETAEAASKKFDEVSAKAGKEGDIESNDQSDESKTVSEGGELEKPTKKSKVPKDDSEADADPTCAFPALSVIDIKKLPPNVKPLLRDPNWTSRAGGNSKRYVYAYRGVCRQQRKGHDRWQSQISFNGTNHYLGTFDSEWDAAAVYAWAHLILYGEEATRKAQLEGEEAAAAFAQQEKDIAEGKMPPPSPKSAKKKKRGAPKKTKVDPTAEKASAFDKDSRASVPNNNKKRPASLKEWNKLKTECAMSLSSGGKGTSKASALVARKGIADMSDKSLMENIDGQLASVSESFASTISIVHHPRMNFQRLPICVPLSWFAPPIQPGGSRAVLIGLSASDFGWEVGEFMKTCQGIGDEDAREALSDEFGPANKAFRTLMLSSPCTFGLASRESQNVLSSSAHIISTLGMSVGRLGCNVGGPERSCSDLAAKIHFMPSKFGNFQFMACNDDDIITLNGRQLSARQGSFPLRDRDICGVGACVFVFIEKIRMGVDQ